MTQSFYQVTLPVVMVITIGAWRQGKRFDELIGRFDEFIARFDDLLRRLDRTGSEVPRS